MTTVLLPSLHPRRLRTLGGDQADQLAQRLNSFDEATQSALKERLGRVILAQHETERQNERESKRETETENKREKESPSPSPTPSGRGLAVEVF